MSIEKIKDSIRNVPNFPKQGIQFKDITTLLENQEAFTAAIDIFFDLYENKNVDAIIGIESRGFIFAAPLALKLGCKFILARKPGKLPMETISEEYELEYGKSKLEIHKDAISENDRVVIVDDLLATGGTANAAKNLVLQLKGKIISFAFLIELNALKGRKILNPIETFSIINY